MSRLKPLFTAAQLLSNDQTEALMGRGTNECVHSLLLVLCSFKRFARTKGMLLFCHTFHTFNLAEHIQSIEMIVREVTSSTQHSMPAESQRDFLCLLSPPHSFGGFIAHRLNRFPYLSS